MLPLHLPSLERYFKYVQKLNGSVLSKQHRQQRNKLGKKACKDVWLWLVVFALNYEFYGGNVPADACVVPWASLNAAQLCSLEILSNSVLRICGSALTHQAVPLFTEVLQHSKVDYGGEEVAKALPLLYEEVVPGLPDKDMAGNINSVSVAAPHVASWLLNADEHLLPREEWPEEITRARMNCTQSEWVKIAIELVERKMAEPIDYEDIFSVDGIAVLNGIFGVLKKRSSSTWCRSHFTFDY